jgi:hypothetical protein
MPVMPTAINTKTLRTHALDQLPSELSNLRSESPDDTITEQLLGAIERGLIPTSTFTVWLGICKSPFAVQQALKQRVSVKVRFSGIAQLKHGLESAQWEEFWDGLGGAAGLLVLFSDLSVREVRSACKAIGRITTDGDVLRKRQRVTELFKGFYPNIFPDVVAKTNDLRPLTKFYQELVPACQQSWSNGSQVKNKKGSGGISERRSSSNIIPTAWEELRCAQSLRADLQV